MFHRNCFVLLFGVVYLWLSNPSASLAQEATDEVIELVLNLLQEPDKDIRSLALEQIRSDVPGEAATKRFAAELTNLTPDAQVGLISALTDRADKAAKPEIIKMLNVDDEEVRIAAVRAFGYLGATEDMDRLIRLLDSKSQGIQVAARLALVRLPGDTTSQKMADKMAQAEASLRVRLIAILTDRRAFETVPSLLKAAVDANSKVRMAAMASLGKLANSQHIDGMVQGVLKAQKGSERAAAEKAVMFACGRMEKRNRVAPLLMAMSKLNRTEHTIMLSTLGRVGGPAALRVIKRAIADPQRHSDGIRAISNWPDASIADEFIHLAKTDQHTDHRITVLRALIRVAPVPDGRTDHEKLELLKTTMKMATRDDERKLALSRAHAIRMVETLRFLIPYLEQKDFAEIACTSIVELAHHRNVRDAHKKEFHQALDQVMATTQNDVLIDRSNRYKNNQTWVRPKK